MSTTKVTTMQTLIKKWLLVLTAVAAGVLLWNMHVSAATATLAPVTGIRQTSISTTKATLSWNKVDGATHYIIYLSSTNKPELSSTGTSYTIDMTKIDSLKLNPGDYLKVYMVACTFQGGEITNLSMARSAEVTVKTLPKTISDFDAEKHDAKAKTLRIGWTKVDSADGMQVEVFSLKTGKKIGSTYKVEKKEYVDAKKISSGQALRMRIRSYTKINGKTYYSAWTTRYTAFLKNAGFKQVGSSKTIKVYWDKVPKVNSYAVYASTTYNGGYKKVGTTTGTSVTFSKLGKKSLAKGRRYYIRIMPIVKVKGKKYDGLMGYWSSGTYAMLY